MLNYKRLIDISWPVSSKTAPYPGDAPFKFDLVSSLSQGQLVNLTSFSMSPHLGSHIDAPAHIKGDMATPSTLAGNLPLAPFLGPALVVDVAPCDTGITWQSVITHLEEKQTLPERVLFRTQQSLRSGVFEDKYSYFMPDLISNLSKRGVKLMGIDTPSVDPFGAQELTAHHELDKHGMFWLESLDLSQVSNGEFFLIALPLKLTELEASPIRAVLLEF